MAAFYLVLITLNALCAVLLCISGVLRQKNYLYSLALLTVWALVFNALSFKLLSTSALEDALFYSRIHTSIILLVLPLFTYTFGNWSRFRHTNTLVLLFTLCCAILLVINAVSAVPLRFGVVEALVSYRTVFGDTAYVIIAGSGKASLFFHALTALNIVLLLAFAYRFYFARKSVMSLVLMVTLVLQLLAAYVGYSIDNQQSSLVYLGGVPLTFLSLVCVLLLSYSLKQKTVQLDEQTQKRIALETAFARLAEDVSIENPAQFYLNTLQTLYEFSHADFILIGLVRRGQEQLVDTKTVLKNGTRVPNFTYSLRGSPCEKVYAQDACYFESGVAALFPDDVFLTEQQVESYIGMPLLDGEGKPVGILAMLFCQPLADKQNLLQLMKVVSVRVSAELRRHQLEQKLQKMAYFDYVSTLPNRASLFDEINSTFYHCQKTGNKAMLMLIDLDYFGDINRKFGFDVGDQVIKQLGQRLTNYASKDVFVARNSGDEFAVLLKHVSGETTSVLNVHWTALSAILAKTCLVGHRQITMQCSMGAVLFPQQIANRFDVISASEHAMQQAKLKGRNQCALFDPGILARLDYKRQLETNLKRALHASDELFLVYQPKVDINGKVCGAEALIRWRGKDNTIIPPAEFIPLAEETGLIHDLGRYVLRYVCTDLLRWQKAGIAMPRVSVNISATEFEQDGFVDELLSLVAESGVACSSLELELTETALLRDAKRVVSELTRLRQSGMSIALDDFGTGYSSLSYLQELPIDVLKIDKSFIDNLAQPRSAELVKAIITIAQQMGLSVVAEGTETQQQVNELTAIGCQIFQGYYFSKPLTFDDFSRFYRPTLPF